MACKKRTRLFIVLILIASFVLCACGKSEAAKAVEQSIEALPDTASLEDAKAILDAYDAYYALEDDDKEDIENYEKLDKVHSELAGLTEAELKNAYDSMKSIILNMATEMSYVLLGWNFAANAPDPDKISDPTTKLGVIQQFWGLYKESLTLPSFNITVTDQILVTVLSALGIRDDLIYNDGLKSKGINTEALGWWLASDEQVSVKIARALWIVLGPEGSDADTFDAALESAKASLDKVSFMAGSERYDVLKEAYDNMVSMWDDIKNMPNGTFDAAKERLDTYKSAFLKAQELMESNP